VGGTLDPSPLEAAVAGARRHRLFVRQLAKSALDLSPPATLLLRQSSRVDLKRQGISPVVYLARCYAMEVGTAARNTLERLDAALAGGLMGENVHAEVTEAYRFLRGLLLRAQLRAISEHRPVGSEILLAELSPLERSRLKGSLRAIKAWQEKAAYHYQTALL
jgi:CBS domain-containing protein